MVNARRLGQLGMLAVGVGIGSAMAATPGVASADNSQVVSSIDPSGLFAAADPAQSLDFQISIDGMDLFPTAGNSAIAFSGAGDMAIAFGAGAQAFAEGGYGDYATADGTDAFAEAGYGGATPATISTMRGRRAPTPTHRPATIHTPSFQTPSPATALTPPPPAATTHQPTLGLTAALTPPLPAATSLTPSLVTTATATSPASSGEIPTPRPARAL